MNAKDNMWCCTNGGGGFEHYNVQEDAQGNSKLTGEGSGQADSAKRCTIDALETWVITY